VDLFLEHLPQLGNAALVVLLSGLIGYEREARRRPAGLRTHILVGLAAWLLVEVGISVADGYATTHNSDPIRIVQAVVYGVSFIGAGTIFTAGRDKNRIVGLTTAATLLATTAIAVAVGFRERFLACAITALILIVLVALGALERSFGTQIKG
jgi:putative Mg2+ transporter-C (MgtC) family protein